MLTFVIPTYNRPHTLEIAVRSIADQIVLGKHIGVDILILDDSGGQFGIAEMCDRLVSDYPNYVGTKQTVAHSDYSTAFHAMFQEGKDREWVWTFGDDDMLQRGALDFIVPLLVQSEEAFIHVAEVGRSNRRAKHKAYKGTMLDLSNEFGLIEMTGFITGNICRGSILARAATTPNWSVYAESSFVQSLALLEQLRNQPCVFMDIPVVATQSPVQTQESLELWNEQNIAGRYILLSKGIELMFEKGILSGLLKPKFFRYLQYHIWDRLIASYTADYLEKKIVWIEDIWYHTAKFARYLDDPKIAQQIIKDIDTVKGMTTLHQYMSMTLHDLEESLQEIVTRRNTDIYPWNYNEET